MIYRSIDQTVDTLSISLVGNYYYAVQNNDGNEEYIFIVNVLYDDTDFHIRKANVGEFVAICINMKHQYVNEPQIVNDCASSVDGYIIMYRNCEFMFKILM